MLLLACGEVDGDHEARLGEQADDDDDERGEELGLVVQDGDSAVGGTDSADEVELAHGEGSRVVCVCVCVCVTDGPAREGVYGS